MSADMLDLCRRLKALGWSMDRISRCVGLPVLDIKAVH